MPSLSLPTVAEHLVLQCVLCGEECHVDDFEAHAEEHARAGECWNRATFAGACVLDDALQGWAVACDGQESVWPHWQNTAELSALAHEPRPRPARRRHCEGVAAACA